MSLPALESPLAALKCTSERTMHRRRILILTALACFSPYGNAAPELTNFRFGILRTIADGVFEFESLTRRIPLTTKNTGFRFGVGFDNPQCEPVEWYEVMYLPA